MLLIFQRNILPPTPTMKKNAVFSSETLICTYQTTWCWTLGSHRGGLKFMAFWVVMPWSSERRRLRFDTRSGHVGFVADKMELGQVFSKCFGFPCQLSFHQLPHNDHNLSSRAGTTSQLVANILNGLSLTPPQEIIMKKLKSLKRTGRFGGTYHLQH
jgi:hypothetical protein